MTKQTKIAAAKQVIASQTKVAAAAIKQMQAAEAAGDMKVAVIAAKKLRKANWAVAKAIETTNITLDDATMVKLGCVKIQKDGFGPKGMDTMPLWVIDFSDAVDTALQAEDGQK